MANPRTLAPGLLLAAPRLGDPNFERTVVLLARHDNSGALGWVLNGKPSGVVKRLLLMSSLVPSGVVLPDVGPYARFARVGGPVQTGTGWVLYRQTEIELAGEIPTGDVLAVTGDSTALAEVLRTQDRDFRLFLGYAGWGPDQLEKEVREGTWLPTDVYSDLVFDGDPELLYDAAYQRAIGAPPGVFMSSRGGSA
jgi:putative transcriptional regulator